MTINNIKINDVKVSVIIPVYKTEKYLGNCLKSVINQTYDNLEIIIIDDGSPDNSWVIADNYCKKDDRVRLIRQRNRGLSGARNTGIEQSSGQYVIFLDSDDTLKLGAIEKLLLVAIQNDSDMVVPDRCHKINEKNGKIEVLRLLEVDDYNNNPLEFAVNTIIGKSRAWRASSLLYKSSNIKENGIKFPVGYTSEDIVFNLRLLAVIKRIDFLDQSILNYLCREGSITRSYRDDLADVMLFIDKQVKSFLLKENMDNKHGNVSRDSLLCRNIIIFVTAEMSPLNKNYFTDKVKKINSILKIERVKNAFNNKDFIVPCFKSVFIRQYYVFMRALIKNQRYFMVSMCAYFCAIIKRCR